MRIVGGKKAGPGFAVVAAAIAGTSKVGRHIGESWADEMWTAADGTVLSHPTRRVSRHDTALKCDFTPGRV